MRRLQCSWAVGLLCRCAALRLCSYAAAPTVLLLLLLLLLLLPCEVAALCRGSLVLLHVLCASYFCLCPCQLEQRGCSGSVFIYAHTLGRVP